MTSKGKRSTSINEPSDMDPSTSQQTLDLAAVVKLLQDSLQTSNAHKEKSLRVDIKLDPFYGLISKGEDVEAWMEKFNVYANCAAWTDQERCRVLSRR